MSDRDFLYSNLSYRLRGLFFEVRNTLGWGHKEKVYHNSLKVKFKNNSLEYTSEARIPIKIDNEVVGTYIPDFVIEDKIMLEIKAKKYITLEDKKQFWQYLRATPYKLGFLVNFGNNKEIEIIRRVFDKARS